MRKVLALALVSLSVSSPAAVNPHCNGWIPQSNGMDWRMCFDAQGQKYCELRKRNNLIVPIPCP